MPNSVDGPTIPRIRNSTTVAYRSSLEDCIVGATFVDGIFLLLRGDQPTNNERTMLNAILVACCDHGQEPPSTAVARVSSSTGNALHVAAAAGLLAMGPKHGCAVSAAMEMLASDATPEVIVREAIAERRRLPGFGHKVYTEHDPRTVALFAHAETLGYYGNVIAKVLCIERELHTAKGRYLPLNIDGALAAILLELQFVPATGNAIFMIGRFPGLIAHAIEASKAATYIRSSPRL